MASQHTFDKLVLFQLLKRFLKAERKRLYTAFCTLLRREVVYIVADLFWRSQPVSYPVKSRFQTAGKRQVRICCGIRRTEFHSCSGAARCGYPYQRTSVLAAPGDVCGRFITGDKALVGIYQRVAHCGQRFCVLHQTCYEAVCLFAQTVLLRVGRVVEYIPAVFEQ
ncbi:putative uncharacterized protein [Eubacterium sp. CAG:786]|nr:putative uncharacterized protein [Eubacterium sp. CAG:786]